LLASDRGGAQGKEKQNANSKPDAAQARHQFQAESKQPLVKFSKRPFAVIRPDFLQHPNLDQSRQIAHPTE
jgi:hypothetical protein